MAETKLAFELGSGLATQKLSNSNYIQGTYTTVATVEDRDKLAIKTDSKEGVIVKGSLVYVQGNDTIYKYNGTAYEEFSGGEGGNAIIDVEELPDNVEEIKQTSIYRVDPKESGVTPDLYHYANDQWNVIGTEGGGIIKVTSLPTENIDPRSIYLLTETTGNSTYSYYAISTGEITSDGPQEKYIGMPLPGATDGKTSSGFKVVSVSHKPASFPAVVPYTDFAAQEFFEVYYIVFLDTKEVYYVPRGRLTKGDEHQVGENYYRDLIIEADALGQRFSSESDLIAEIRNYLRTENPEEVTYTDVIPVVMLGDPRRGGFSFTSHFLRSLQQMSQYTDKRYYIRKSSLTTDTVAQTSLYIYDRVSGWSLISGTKDAFLQDGEIVMSFDATQMGDYYTSQSMAQLLVGALIEDSDGAWFSYWNLTTTKNIYSLHDVLAWDDTLHKIALAPTYQFEIVSVDTSAGTLKPNIEFRKESVIDGSDVNKFVTELTLSWSDSAPSHLPVTLKLKLVPADPPSTAYASTISLQSYSEITIDYTTEKISIGRMGDSSICDGARSVDFSVESRLLGKNYTLKDVLSCEYHDDWMGVDHIWWTWGNSDDDVIFAPRSTEEPKSVPRCRKTAWVASDHQPEWYTYADLYFDGSKNTIPESEFPIKLLLRYAKPVTSVWEQQPSLETVINNDKYVVAYDKFNGSGGGGGTTYKEGTGIKIATDTISIDDTVVVKKSTLQPVITELNLSGTGVTGGTGWYIKSGNIIQGHANWVQAPSTTSKMTFKLPAPVKNIFATNPNICSMATDGTLTLSNTAPAASSPTTPSADFIYICK